MSTMFPQKRASVAELAAGANETLKVGHVFLDAQRRSLRFLNQRARDLYKEGVPFIPADLGKHHLATSAGEAVEPHQLPLIIALREENNTEAEFLMERPSGPVWRVVWNASPIKNGQGQLLGVTASVSAGPVGPDWRVLAELTHDLRTPLQAIGMLSTILEANCPLDGNVVEALQRLRSASERAMDVGRDLLEWCRSPVQSGRAVHSTWFELEPFLRRLAQEQVVAAQKKGLVLNTELDTLRTWEIHSDRIRLGRILANLLSNAIRYTISGHVEFVANWRDDGDGKFLAISVLDTGVGFCKEEQESIFEPFEQGRAGKDSDAGGSGLGLASVDNLIHELQLSLEVYSEHQRGSMFHVVIPMSQLRQIVR